MIVWINPKDSLPELYTRVAVLIYHRKNAWPESAEIFFGLVEESVNKEKRVTNFDDLGYGCMSWYFIDNGYDQPIAAWAYSNEFPCPHFIKPNLG